MLAAAERKADSYNFSGLPVNLALSMESFGEVLAENNVTGDKFERCMNFFLMHKEKLFSSMTNCAMNQMLDIYVMEQGVREGSPISGFNWIVGGNLMISPNHFKQGLLELTRLLRENKNFSLALIDDYALPHVRSVSLQIKENTIAVANSRVEGTPCPMIMKEPTIVQAFYQYFKRYWSSIPRIQREKSSVINRLEQLAD
jgi:hypothetical protein